VARGDLEVLRLLGEGGHGAVYLGRHRGSLGFERLVALKVVRENARLPDLIAERFVHEARLLGLLQHRAIVTADDVVELDIGTAIVMQYVPGIDLFDVVRLNHASPGSVPVTWLAHVGLEVASALAAAWSSPSALTGKPLRVLHCDVKPSNVRVSGSGEVKLLDFGVATSLIDETMEGPVMGTLGYVSPERLETGRAGPASDLFSLGLTLLAVARGHGMAGRPRDGTPLARWVENSLSELPSVYGPLVTLLRDLLSTDAVLRPDHDEVRTRLFQILRTHADTPPTDLSSDIVARVGEATRSTSADETLPESVHAPHMPRTLDSLESDPLSRDGLPPPAELRRSTPALPPPPNAPPPPPPAIRPANADRESVERAELSRLVATWGPGDRGPAVPPPAPPPVRHTPADRVLAAASEFAGWFDLELAQAVLGPELQRTGRSLPRVLEELVTRGSMEGVRLEGVAHARVSPGQLAGAAHALARWPADDRKRLARRHVDHIVERIDDAWLDRLCKGLGPGSARLDALEADLARVLARAPRESGIPVRLALTVIRCHRAGHLDDLARHFEPLRNDPALSPAERVRVQRWYGQFILEAPPTSPARFLEEVDAALDAAREVRDLRNEAALWGQRGVCLIWTSEASDALDALELSRRMSQEQGDPLRSAVAGMNLMLILSCLGRQDEARRVGLEAERTVRHLGARKLHVTILGNLANHTREAGDLERALRFGSRAVHAAQALDRSDNLAHALTSRGLVYLQAGDLEGAVEDLAEARGQYRPSRVQMHAWTTAWLAGVHLLMKQPRPAAALLDGLRSCRSQLFGVSAVVTDAWSARLAAAQGDKVRARSSLAAAEAGLAKLSPLDPPSVRRLVTDAHTEVRAT